MAGATSTSADLGRIFISYRREDSAFPAGWLYDRLCARFGSDYVFKDVDSIEPGDDFLRVIEEAVGSCQVLLALIGDHWLDITDGTGHRRLDDPNDFVRLEIEAALRRDVRVIPILVGRAPLPGSEQLPDSLRGLIRRQAIELSPNRFEPDVARLVRTIDKTLAVVGEGPADAPRPVDRTTRWKGPPAEGHGNPLADPQWIDAVNAFWAKRWAEAVQRFEALAARYPGEDRVETRLTDARRQRDIQTWSAKAETAAAEDDWDSVVTALENLTTLDPAYPDVASRLEQAKTAQRRKVLVDDITALHQAGQWEAVAAAAEALTRLDPDNPDPGGIVSDARDKIRAAELAERYAQALNQLDQEHWQQAAELLAAIEQDQAGYRDAASLLATAQQQCDLATWSDQAAAAAEHDNWDTAVTALEEVCQIDRAYRDAGARLKQARSAQRLRSLVDKVTALHRAGRWKDVLAAGDEMAQLDPTQADPNGMVSDARAKVREKVAELKSQLDATTQRSKTDWQLVLDAITQLTELDHAAAAAYADLRDSAIEGISTHGVGEPVGADSLLGRLDERYGQARAAEEAGQWAAAAAMYSSIEGHRDSRRRRVACQQRQRKDGDEGPTWYADTIMENPVDAWRRRSNRDDAKRHSKQSRWSAVVDYETSGRCRSTVQLKLDQEHKIVISKADESISVDGNSALSTRLTMGRLAPAGFFKGAESKQSLTIPDGGKRRACTLTLQAKSRWGAEVYWVNSCVVDGIAVPFTRNVRPGLLG